MKGDLEGLRKEVSWIGFALAVLMITQIAQCSNLREISHTLRDAAEEQRLTRPNT